MKNKFFQFLFLLAALSFILTWSGGQYLHNKIHHHDSAQSQEQCPFQVLLNQIALVVPLAAVVSFLLSQRILSSLNKLFFNYHVVSLPFLRAPPLALL